MFVLLDQTVQAAGSIASIFFSYQDKDGHVNQTHSVLIAKAGNLLLVDIEGSGFSTDYRDIILNNQSKPTPSPWREKLTLTPTLSQRERGFYEVG